jgi:hypothetical protein
MKAENKKAPKLLNLSKFGGFFGTPFRIGSSGGQCGLTRLNSCSSCAVVVAVEPYLFMVSGSNQTGKTKSPPETQEGSLFTPFRIRT